MVIHDHIPEKAEIKSGNARPWLGPESYFVAEVRSFVSKIADKASGKERLSALLASLIFFENFFENVEKFAGGIFSSHFTFNLKDLVIQPNLKDGVHPDIGINLVRWRVLRTIEKETRP